MTTDKKAILVIGAGDATGGAIARRFAREGYIACVTRREAEKLGTDFLGEVPLDIAIRETSDGGNPIVVSSPESAHAQLFRAMAERVWTKLSGGPKRAAPRIVIQ